MKHGTQTLDVIEYKLDANPDLKYEYMRVLGLFNYISLIEDPKDGYYMPHHVIIKEVSLTTKVRVVFDASAKTNSGVSLNDMFLTGLTIQNKLFAHLIRFHNIIIQIRYYH